MNVWIFCAWASWPGRASIPYRSDRLASPEWLQVCFTRFYFCRARLRAGGCRPSGHRLCLSIGLLKSLALVSECVVVNIPPGISWSQYPWVLFFVGRDYLGQNFEAMAS